MRFPTCDPATADPAKMNILTNLKTVNINWRFATAENAALLAEWNYRLIRDEGHRNTMTVQQLEERMRSWLDRDYKAVIFSDGKEPLGYGLYRHDTDSVYLRQFYILSEYRRRGYGRAGMRILQEEIWPRDIRLTVDVLCRNEPGIAFWRAIGYRDYCLTLEIMPDNKSENIS